jgi:three-Cys-motif partner protein
MSRHAHDEHFEEFPPHTRFKHLCLQFYLEAWVHKVGLGRAADDQLVMVDAFAGEGADEVGNHGSPLRMARIAAMNEAAASSCYSSLPG